MNAFDIIGPVMIGPSSSHTAGAVRLGQVARALLGSQPVHASLGLHGSFAKTYKGHGTDKALIGGILGFATDDERIRFAPDLAQKSGLALEIHPQEIDGAHPNTALIALANAQGRQARVQGSSIGGGSILITSVNGMKVHLTAQAPTLIVQHQDAPGAIAAVTSLLAGQGVNLRSIQLARPQKGGQAVMTLEMDSPPAPALCDQVRGLPGILGATLLEPV